MGVSLIAKSLNRTESSVRQKLFKLDINTKKWSKEEDGILTDRYPSTPVKFLLTYLPNRSESAILNRANVLRLKADWQKRLPYKKYKHNTNHDFFNKETLSSCYWAGFISADGWIQSDRSKLGIKLAEKDINHIKRFRDEIETESPIAIKTQKSFGVTRKYAEICVYSHKIIKSLNENFNIADRKTLINQPPTIKCSDCKVAFIVGLLDGDGSVYKVGNGFRTTFLGTKAMLEWVKVILVENLGDVNSSILEKGNIYSLTVYNDITIKLIEWIDNNNLYCLTRKLGRWK